MRLLRTDRDDLVLETFNDERKLPKYAILSHTWLKDTEEVTFHDLDHVAEAVTKEGYKKLQFARKQAWIDKIQYVWLDTCCIDKSSSAELAEAINSMFRWYEKAAVCYVYLDDLPAPDQDGATTLIPASSRGSLTDKMRKDRNGLSRPLLGIHRHSESRESSTSNVWDENNGTRVGEVEGLSVLGATATNESQERLLMTDMPGQATEMQEFIHLPERRSPHTNALARSAPSELPVFTWNWAAFRNCRWFSRGWTLQEMIAPPEVRFYNQDWQYVGTLSSLADLVADITGVHRRALKGQWPIASFSIAQKMCWAAGRQTTRAEDRAYSLLGIFDISMPVIYGEGERAFLRLQQALLGQYSDQTIFAWFGSSDLNMLPLASSEGRDIQSANNERLALGAAESSQDAALNATGEHNRESTVLETNSVSATSDRPASGMAKQMMREQEQAHSDLQVWRESHLLAHSPEAFKGCERMVPVDRETPQEAYRVTNREVSFELPVYSRHDNVSSSPYIRAVLNCCLEDDPTKIIAIKLSAVAETRNTYYVGGMGPRVIVADLYDIAPKCSAMSFSVLLSVDQVQQRERVLAQDTIACRLKEPKGSGSSGFYLGRVIPEAFWNADSACFILPQDERPMVVTLESSPRKLRLSASIDICMKGHIAELGVFQRFIKRATPQLHRSAQRREMGTTQTGSNIKSDAFLTLLLSQSQGSEPDQTLNLRFRHNSQAKARLSIFRLTSTQPLAVSYTEGIALTATVMTKQLLRESMTIVELEVVSIGQAIWLFTCFILAVLFSLMLLPGSVLVPILTLGAVRSVAYSGYVGDTGPSFGRGELMGLAVGTALTVLIGIGVLVRGGPLPVRWQPTSWKWGMLGVLSLASLIMCSVWAQIRSDTAYPGYLLSANITHFNSTLSSDVLANGSLYYGTMHNASIQPLNYSDWHFLYLNFAVFRNTACALQITILVIATRFWRRRRSELTVSIVALNVLTLVPILATQSRSNAVLTPWTHEACAARLIPESVDVYFDANSNYTGQNYTDICDMWAGWARLQWSVFGLGIWELALEVVMLIQLFDVLGHVEQAIDNAWDLYERTWKLRKRS